MMVGLQNKMNAVHAQRDPGSKVEPKVEGLAR